MPELPEVELCRRELSPLLPGRQVDGFRCTQPSLVRSPLRDVEGFLRGVRGRTVEAVERRGKRLLLRLDDGAAVGVGFGLWAHLELRLLPLDPLQGAEFSLAARFSGQVLAPDPGGAVRLQACDEPVPGPVWLCLTESALANLALVSYEPSPPPPPYDALDQRLTGERLSRLAPPRATVKGFLTDDRYVLGLGSGYVDELLWAAQEHPRRPAAALSTGEWEVVAAAMRQVLCAALEAGGETGFVAPLGGVGAYERRIHHRGGAPCPRCRTPLGSIMAGRRETNFCPVCQPL